MELLNRKFTSQSVALATGVDAKSIQNWAARGMLIGHREATGKGNPVAFSWFNVMEVAIAAELQEIGVPSIQEAFSAAQGFAHVGHSPSGWVGDEPDGPDRLPGLPWHHSHGKTMLFLYEGGSGLKHIADNGLVNLYAITPQFSRFTSLKVVNVSEIFNRVVNRMAMNPSEVLDEAYAKPVKA